MTAFDFPLDQSGRVTREAIGRTASDLIDKLQPIFLGPHIDALAEDPDGKRGDWATMDVVLAASAAAFLLGKNPETDYDAALIRQAAMDRSMEFDVDLAAIVAPPTATP